MKQVWPNHFITINHDYGRFAIRQMAYFAEYISGEFHLSDHDQIKFAGPGGLTDFDLAEADRPVAGKLATRPL